MAVFADGKIEAYVGPPGLGAADDLEAVIVDFIGGARRRLDIAVQELDSEAIARAILAASWRGIRVTLFLEQDYLRSVLKRGPDGVPLPPKPKAGETPAEALERVQWSADETELAENRRILGALLRSDVEVRGDFNPKIFHQKFILRDYYDGKATSPGNPALLTGSANFTVDRHPREPEPRLRVPLGVRLAPVRARVPAAPARHVRARAARGRACHLRPRRRPGEGALRPGSHPGARADEADAQGRRPRRCSRSSRSPGHLASTTRCSRWPVAG